jgi:hypothetical protein
MLGKIGITAQQAVSQKGLSLMELVEEKSLYKSKEQASNLNYGKLHDSLAAKAQQRAVEAELDGWMEGRIDRQIDRWNGWMD